MEAIDKKQEAMEQRLEQQAAQLATFEQQAAEQKEVERAAAAATAASEAKVATMRAEYKEFMESWTSRVHDELDDAEISRLSEEQQESLSKHPKPLADC